MHTLVAVVGPGVGDDALMAVAEEVGAELAHAGVRVVCGGLGGVMEAACRGAKPRGGLTVGVLPGADRAAANPFVDVAVPTARDAADAVGQALTLAGVAGRCPTAQEDPD